MLPIVLVPGLLCKAEVFSAQIPALWRYGPVQVASTLEGTSMAEIAGAILASAPARFALDGISMDGYIFLKLCGRLPNGLQSLPC